jgi:hypothetical protein
MLMVKGLSLVLNKAAKKIAIGKEQVEDLCSAEVPRVLNRSNFETLKL